MHPSCLFKVLSVVTVVAFLTSFSPAQEQSSPPENFPYPEKLTYQIEWRLINAGVATVQMSHPSPNKWNLDIDLQSAGLVSRLYRVLDAYKVSTNGKFCGESTSLDAQEGKKHTITRLTFDNTKHKVDYDEHDLIKNVNVRNQLDIPPCTYEIAGALVTLRATNLEPGKSMMIPITNGKKSVNARIEAQARETIAVNGKNYQTIRYEAYLFDNVLYKRKGRFLMWVTDDAERVPVQFRMLMGFPIGSVTVLLDKQQKT
jgi:hypothetical protein